MKGYDQNMGVRVFNSSTSSPVSEIPVDRRTLVHAQWRAIAAAHNHKMHETSLLL